MPILLALLLALAGPESIAVPVDRATPAAAATPTATNVAKRARAFYEQIRANTIDRRLLTPRFAAELTPEIVATLARGLGPLGAPTAFVERARHDIDGVATYDYTVSLASGTLALTIGIDEARDAIARFYVRRAAGTASR